MHDLRKKILVLFLGLFIFAVLLYGYAYFVSSQKLQVVFQAKNLNIKASVYRLGSKDTGTDLEKFVTKDRLVAEINQDKTLKLKKGKYVLSTSGNADYAAQTEIVNLENRAQITTIDPAYSSVRLTVLLKQEKPAVHQQIIAAFPIITPGYVISDGRLYGHGEWYGATVRPNQTAEQSRLNYTDVYRVVAYKENGTWKVVTKPPQLVLSRIAYPDVPLAVLKDVNSL